jgi:Major Facilitator Superfamily/Trypsin-like peptidase domain
VITNYHVIDGASQIGVRMTSGEFVAAHLVGVAPNYDLAVLQADGARSPLRPIAVGRSADLQVGQEALAIGNPYGLEPRAIVANPHFRPFFPGGRRADGPPTMHSASPKMTINLKTADGAIAAEGEETRKLKFSGYQKFVVGLLAFLQFSIILDFMIISPLGATIMPDLEIGPQRFGEIVSAYAFSAGISGIVAAGFADRFDRKRFLLFFYFGFIIGTALCALAPNYHLLLLARIVTGLFGGVIGSVVLAIATDLFPFQMRGRVMGVVQTAFSASQVLGIPVGLY